MFKQINNLAKENKDTIKDIKDLLNKYQETTDNFIKWIADTQLSEEIKNA
jgi:hypothetical protein